MTKRVLMLKSHSTEPENHPEKRMNTILTCTDGSIYAPSVYAHAAWAANRMDAAVHILHMLDPNHERAETMDLSGNLTLDNRKELLQELVALEETKNRLGREQGKLIIEEGRRVLTELQVATITAEQQHGELVESVTRMERNASLVVLGKRGESADFAKLHLGSNLERVIRGSIRPVLVASRKFVPIERFLLAYDGGPSITKAIEFARENPLLKGLECHLVQAGKIDSNAEWYLQETAGKLREAGYQVEAKAIPGDAAKVIAEVVRQSQIHLLVMGAYGHSKIRQLIIGSTTTEMVRTCQIPLLMFR